MRTRAETGGKLTPLLAGFHALLPAVPVEFLVQWDDEWTKGALPGFV